MDPKKHETTSYFSSVPFQFNLLGYFKSSRKLETAQNWTLMPMFCARYKHTSAFLACWNRALHFNFSFMPKLSPAKYSSVYKTVLIKKAPDFISVSRFKMTDLKGKFHQILVLTRHWKLRTVMICNSYIAKPGHECPEHRYQYKKESAVFELHAVHLDHQCLRCLQNFQLLVTDVRSLKSLLKCGNILSGTCKKNQHLLPLYKKKSDAPCISANFPE